MRVTVRVFARLRELTGVPEWICEVADGATIGDVWRQSVAEHAALAPFGRTVSAARNADFAKMTTAVADGDDIAFLPPVSGGSL